MEEPRAKDECELVRCLECGFVYELLLAPQEAAPCPYCGGVSWIALDAARYRNPESDS